MLILKSDCAFVALQMMQTQRSLGDVFSELSQKNPELREEFTYNSETQRVLCKNGETLLGELKQICYICLSLSSVLDAPVFSIYRCPVSSGVCFLSDNLYMFILHENKLFGV